jgi:hypothetical protein
MARIFFALVLSLFASAQAFMVVPSVRTVSFQKKNQQEVS